MFGLFVIALVTLVADEPHRAACHATSLDPLTVADASDNTLLDDSAPPAGFDPAPWRADYLELREALSTGYANLEWALAHRGLDPYALDRRTLATIEAARSDLDGLGDRCSAS